MIQHSIGNGLGEACLAKSRPEGAAEVVPGPSSKGFAVALLRLRRLDQRGRGTITDGFLNRRSAAHPLLGGGWPQAKGAIALVGLASCVVASGC
jgi:hypothetical protein